MSQVSPRRQQDVGAKDLPVFHGQEVDVAVAAAAAAAAAAAVVLAPTVVCLSKAPKETSNEFEGGNID